jgi:hypothetical protein
MVGDVVSPGGRMKTKGLLTITLLLVSGCGATFEQLQARAAVDFGCHPAGISSQAIDGYTRIASGCGKQAVYVETCTSNNHSGCTWMLNSPIKPAD